MYKYAAGRATILRIARCFNMPGVTVNGHDFFAVYEAAGEAIVRAREEAGPSLIECKGERSRTLKRRSTAVSRPGRGKKIREKSDCICELCRQGHGEQASRSRRIGEIDQEMNSPCRRCLDQSQSSDKARRTRPVHRRLCLILNRRINAWAERSPFNRPLTRRWPRNWRATRGL
jgi:TPP-dependent pyruvate/acetoin dehydrogenase alpha subunit